MVPTIWTQVCKTFCYKCHVTSLSCHSLKRVSCRQLQNLSGVFRSNMPPHSRAPFSLTLVQGVLMLCLLLGSVVDFVCISLGVKGLIPWIGLIQNVSPEFEPLTLNSMWVFCGNCVVSLGMPWHLEGEIDPCFLRFAGASIAPKAAEEAPFQAQAVNFVYVCI